MTTLLEGIWNEVMEAFSIWDYDAKKELIDIKKEIAKEYIDSIKKENPALEMVEDSILDYLVNEWMIEDVFKDIFRWVWMSILLPESIENLNKIKERLSLIKDIPTEAQLSSLKSEITSIWSLPTTNNNWTNTNQTSWSNPTSQQATTSDNSTSQQTTTQSSPEQPHESTASPETLDSEKEFIKLVYQKASSQIGTKYTRAWTKPETWFDCSWLWNWAFKEVWINFKSRMTAHSFSDANVNIQKQDVQIWDFMFWDQKPWSNKHNTIYHIEMVISQPYTKNWKTYVRTLWSSTDTTDDRRNYVGDWVQFREREMKDYRHYGRPTYYYQLALHQQTWDNSDLIAGTNRPTQEMKDNVLNA